MILFIIIKLLWLLCATGAFILICALVDNIVVMVAVLLIIAIWRLLQ